MFIMSVYSAWSIKLGLMDTDINPLFALLMVLLSIYGLWVIIKTASAYLFRSGKGNFNAGARYAPATSRSLSVVRVMLILSLTVYAVALAVFGLGFYRDWLFVVSIFSGVAIGVSAILCVIVQLFSSVAQKLT